MVRLVEIYRADLHQVDGVEDLSDKDAKIAEGWGLFSDATKTPIFRSFNSDSQGGRTVKAYLEVEGDTITDSQIERAREVIENR